MLQLVFFPLDCGGLRSERRENTPLVIDESTVEAKHCELWVRDDGQLEASPPSGDTRPDTARSLLAILWLAVEGAHRVWYLVGRSQSLAINGVKPLPLARLELGSLFSVNQSVWFASALWKPSSQPAPVDVAEKPCPICGSPLAEAPVIQCPSPGCARWMHLERPDQPESPDALNCYLTAGECGECHRPASLEPLLIPEPHEKLLAAMEDNAGAQAT